MKRAIMALAGAALLATGCATGMSETDCGRADWFAIGQQDGLVGEARDRFGARAEQCAAYGLPADYDRYFAGRDRGLDRYCTAEAGYEAGRSGQPYRGVCPPEREGAFLAEYNIGARLYQLTENHKSAAAAYETALSNLQQNRDALRRARDRLRAPDLPDAERVRLERDVERYRRDIDRAERDLPRLRREIDDAYGRLEDYREYLRRRY